MYHAVDLTLVFGLNRKTVSSVPHGNHCILQIGAAGVENAVQLSVNPVIDASHGTANLAKSWAGVIAYLIF